MNAKKELYQLMNDYIDLELDYITFDEDTKKKAKKQFSEDLKKGNYQPYIEWADEEIRFLSNIGNEYLSQKNMALKIKEYLQILSRVQ